MNAATSLLFVLMMLLDFSFVWSQSGANFEHCIIDASPPDNIWFKTTADFNSDGKVDLLIGGHNGRARDFIIWYQNPGVETGQWTKHTVYEGNGGYGFEGGAAGDLDGDGDADVVFGSYWQHKLFWLENTGPATPHWKLHELGTPKSGTTYLHDFNNDGRLDIVTRASQKYSGDVGKDVWLWQQNRPDSWTKYSKAIGDGEFVNIGDVDMDGKTDIVVANQWLRNNGSIDIATWKSYTFTDDYKWLCTFPLVVDINRDGRNDIVLTPTVWAGEFAKTAWYEAPAEQTKNSWTEHIIEDQIECVTHALGVHDFDGDGSFDVFTAEMNVSQDPDEIRIYYNKDDKGSTWQKHVIGEGGSHSNQFIDFDGDGDMDILGSNHGGAEKPTIELWINRTK